MDAYQLQERLDDVRLRLLEAIAPLSDEALTRPGVVGAWSVADVLSHLVSWEAELVTALMRVDQGKRPARLLNALTDRQEYNRRRHSETEDRDLDRIFEDLQNVRQKLEDWLEEFSGKTLTDPRRFSWLHGKPLWRLIAEVSYEHEGQHLPALESFSRRWMDEEAVAVITPTDIEVNENGDQR